MPADAMTVTFEPVTESLLVLQDRINQAAASLMQLGMMIGGTPVEDRCEYSDLYVTQCAHCLGHVPDWETPKKVQVYE